MKFIFLLTVWSYEAPTMQVYVVESGLSSFECMALMEQYHTEDPSWPLGVPSCEVDMEDEL